MAPFRWEYKIDDKTYAYFIYFVWFLFNGISTIEGYIMPKLAF